MVSNVQVQNNTRFVNYTLDEVTRMLPVWKLIRDCVKGQRAIKKARAEYLPKPLPNDLSDENVERYNQYLERAVFYNVTRKTLAGLVGEVFRKEPLIELASPLSLLMEDVDGTGIALKQQAKRTLSNVLAYGRCGLFTDYPTIGAVATLEEINSGSVRPTITLYEPWRIVNWRMGNVDTGVKLVLVVLVEDYIYRDYGFYVEYREQWRVLRLDKGVYSVEIYRADEQGVFERSAVYYPKDYAGNNLNEIPFTFVGSINNDPEIDDPPLYDLSILNIGHYRNSADYEESVFMVGQPTPYLTGLTQSWVDEVLRGRIQLGSRAAILLPEGGTAGLLQVNPNVMPIEAMLHKEKQMIALGARLFEQTKVQRTATEATQDEASETSILSTSADNTAMAYQKSLGYAGMYVGRNVVSIFEIDTDFSTDTLSVEERKQLVAEWTLGAITFEEMRDSLVRAKVAYLDAEAAKDAVETIV